MSLKEQVFFNRGFIISKMEHYLSTTDDDIYNPLLLDNIEDGVKLLTHHIANQNDIFIQVDPDVDGFTSAAALINYLYSLFPNFVQNHIYYRLQTGKQHGIIPNTVPENIKLVIAPDSSSNSIKECEELHNRGIDILILDHHESDELPKYGCVINNQTCEYPNKSLSGVGIVYKFCQLIDNMLQLKESDNILDLVALGIISDVMDLTNYETKRLIDKGIENIRNPFFKELLKVQNFSISRGGGICPFTIAFYITPLINSVIRVGTQEDKLLVFESMIDFKGYELIPSTKRGEKGKTEAKVTQACRVCNNVKNKQTKIRDEDVAKIENLIEENNLLDNKILFIQAPKNLNLDKNLTGLVANQIMGKYQKPTLLLHEVKDNENNVNKWEGSGRGYDKSDFTNLRDFLIQSKFFNYAQGHQSAFGASISDENIKSFIEFSNEQLKNYDFSTSYKVDRIYQSNTINGKDILDIAELRTIWGQGLPIPIIAIENINVNKSNISLLSPDKNPTIKITLPNGISLMKFKSSKEEYEKLYTELGNNKINIVGKCEQNIWNGIVSPQIIIEQYEIVEAIEYYF